MPLSRDAAHARNDTSAVDTQSVGSVQPDDEVRKGVRFERIFRAHCRAVERFVEARYPTVDRDDLVSLTFEVAWRRLDSAPDNLERGWLLGIAQNHALNAIRGRRRRRSWVEALVAQPAEHVSMLHSDRVPADTVERLAAALDQLAPRDREVIELAAFGGLRGAELGAALGTSAGAASVRLHRARQRLAETYGADQ